MSDTKETAETAKEAVGAVGAPIKAAERSEEARKAAKNLGEVALTVAKTVKLVLLPLAAVNYAYDRAKAYFVEKFERDLAEKAAHIPPEDLIEPKASVA